MATTGRPASAESNGEKDPSGDRPHYEGPDARKKFYDLHVRPLLEAGHSYESTARQLHIGRSSVRRFVVDFGAPGTPGERPRTPEGPLRPWAGGSKHMPGEEGEFDTRLRLAKIEWERDRDREDRKALDSRLDRIAEAVAPLTKKPLSAELHEGQLHVSCPNCGTSREVPLPEGGPDKFDDVLKLFSRPHEGGANAMNCKNCRPKVEAAFKEMGYAIAPIPKPESSD